VGVVYPHDADIDDELREFLPAGVELRSAHTPAPTEDVTVQLLIRMAEHPEIEEAASELVAFEPHCIAYACTSASFVRGVGYDEDISRRIQSKTGVDATTTSTGMVTALRALGIKKVAVGAPYLDEVNGTLRSFLEDSGFAVTKLYGLNMTRGDEIAELSYEEISHLAREADTKDADGVFLSCTGLRTAAIIDDLEQELGKPMVTANQATIWASLCIMGIKGLPTSRGQLFRATASLG
jgi:maleate isomerase